MVRAHDMSADSDMQLAHKLQAEERVAATRETELPSLGRPLSSAEIAVGSPSSSDRVAPRPARLVDVLTGEHSVALSLGKTTRSR